MTRLLKTLAACAVIMAPAAAQAGSVGVGDFSSAAISFGNPGGTDTVPEGLSIGPATFTDANSANLIWWSAGNGYADCVDGCVTTSAYGVGSLDIAVTPGFNKIGLYVGQATGFSLDVSFYDAGSNLLGTLVAAGPGDGVAFVGWESVADIASIRIGNTLANGYVISAQSGYFERAAVPEPASWAMMIAGMGIAGAAMRRRKMAVRFA